MRGGERALVVGAGAGYGAAVLAACGAAVTALEEDEALLALARANLARGGAGGDVCKPASCRTGRRVRGTSSSSKARCRQSRLGSAPSCRRTGGGW